MKKPVLIISTLVLVLAGFCTWYFLENFKRVSHERELPMQGEARYNPLYALKLSLRELGQQAETHARLDLGSLKLEVHDTLVLYSPPNGLTQLQLEQLLA